MHGFFVGIWGFHRHIRWSLKRPCGFCCIFNRKILSVWGPQGHRSEPSYLPVLALWMWVRWQGGWPFVIPIFSPIDDPAVRTKWLEWIHPLRSFEYGSCLSPVFNQSLSWPVFLVMTSRLQSRIDKSIRTEATANAATSPFSQKHFQSPRTDKIVKFLHVPKLELAQRFWKIHWWIKMFVEFSRKGLFYYFKLDFELTDVDHDCVVVNIVKRANAWCCYVNTALLYRMIFWPTQRFVTSWNNLLAQPTKCG